MIKNFGVKDLHPTIGEWITEMGWSSLKDIQLSAFEHFTSSEQSDLILSAPTAGGKTMAAFLPLLNKIAKRSKFEEGDQSYDVLYICPTRALINQQARQAKENIRASDLVSLCAKIGISVTPWSSDVYETTKENSWNNPEGVLIITPESLEGRFIKSQNEVKTNFSRLSAIVIDELHAYFETPRGFQLISQITRLEELVGKKTRIAMSATLGNGSKADQLKIYQFLRPGTNVIPEQNSVTKEDKQIFISLTIRTKSNEDPMNAKEKLDKAIASDVYEIYENKQKGIVFTNTRRDAEELSKKLNDLTLSQESNDAYRDYVVHHGPLDKKLRKNSEDRMRDEKVKSILVATSTLELGIDIGTIKEVAQIGPGSSVSSLRQRLGRSGRVQSETINGKTSINPDSIPRLHVFIRESKIDSNDHFINKLRLPTFQTLAQISLLRKGLFESPSLDQLQLSTFVQQLLSLVHEYRHQNVTSADVRSILVDKGPFSRLREPLYNRKGSVSIFDGAIQWLSTMPKPLLAIEVETGRLYCTPAGRGVIQTSFFSTAFKSASDYKLITTTGSVIGTVSTIHYTVGDRILYDSRTWEVTGVDHKARRLDIRPAAGSSTINFFGESIDPSDEVIHEMRALYKMPDDEFTHYIRTILSSHLDPNDVIIQGKNEYETLEDLSFKIIAGDIFWFPWVGYRVVRGICSALNFTHIKAVPFKGCILIQGQKRTQLMESIKRLTSQFPTRDDLSLNAGGFAQNKFDGYLSPSFWRKEYAFQLAQEHLMIKSLTQFADDLQK